MIDDNDKRVDEDCPECGRTKSAAAADAQGTVTFWCRGGHKWNPLAPKLSSAEDVPTKLPQFPSFVPSSTMGYDIRDEGSSA